MVSVVTSRDSRNQYKIFEEVSGTKPQNTYWLKQSEDFSDSVEVSDKSKKSNAKQAVTGVSVATSMIVTAGAIFALMRGGGAGKLANRLKKWEMYLTRKLNSANLSEEKLGPIISYYKTSLKFVRALLERAEVVNNFTTFKDLGFSRIMHSNKFTGKIHDAVTETFERLGRQTVMRSYSGTLSSIHKTESATKSLIMNLSPAEASKIIEINGVKMTKVEWLKKIQKLNGSVQKIYAQEFSATPLQRRYFSVKKFTSRIKEQVKLRSFLDKNVFSRFLSDSVIQENRDLVKAGIRKHRLGISDSVSELFRDTKTSLDKIYYHIDFKDKSSAQVLDNLRKNLSNYVTTGASDAELKTQIIEGLKELSHTIPKTAKNSDAITKEIRTLSERVKGFKPGAVEEILAIYEKILPKSQYDEMAKLYRRSIENLDQSIKIETEDFTNKLRDLVMGSAPTDMLTLLGGLGTLGYNLGKADDNDQRTSIALKYGVPALSAIAISFYSNAKLFAGIKSLLIASISSMILNRIGTVSDEFLKNLKHSDVEASANA